MFLLNTLRTSWCDAHAPTPARNPKIVPALLIVGFADADAGMNRLNQNRSGAMIPCYSPAQKPAGVTPGNLYFESLPAMASMFGIWTILSRKGVRN